MVGLDFCGWLIPTGEVRTCFPEGKKGRQGQLDDFCHVKAFAKNFPCRMRRCMFSPLPGNLSLAGKAAGQQRK